MRVLVCGAAGGIGSACVELLTARGDEVSGVDRDSIDIAVPGGAERAVEYAVDTLGGLDGVVHAVGMSGRRLGDGPVSSCTDEAWREVLRVNLDSVRWLLRAALPVLGRAAPAPSASGRATPPGRATPTPPMAAGTAGGGSVVVVGSALARTLDADFLTAAYAASKAAAETLVRMAAFEGAPAGIRVNAVAPGLVDTPMAGRAVSDPRIQERLGTLMPLGGVVPPGEVAAAVGWLLSPASARVTGAVVPVDGGWNLR